MTDIRMVTAGVLLFPARPVESLIRLEDKNRDEIRHRVDSLTDLPRATRWFYRWLYSYEGHA